VQFIAERSYQGDQDKNAPETVYDAGNCREQLDYVFENSLQGGGQKVLSEEDGYANAEEAADHESQQRAVEGPPYLREYAELMLVRIPICRCDEAQAIFLHGRDGMFADFPQNPKEEQHYEYRATTGKYAKDFVGPDFHVRRRRRNGILRYNHSDQVPRDHGIIPYSESKL
jgi:hypothetical protein